jgi:hypothetical protein
MNLRWSSSRLTWREGLSCLLWVAAGLVLAVETLGSHGIPTDSRYTLLMLVVSALFLYAGVGYAFHLPAARGLIVVLSVVLMLYALLLVLFGTEDVGGPWVSIPAALALLVFATHNVLCVLRPPVRRGDAQ